MSLLYLVLVVVLVGVGLWALNMYVPMQPTVKKILNAVVIIALVVWVLGAFGVWGHFGDGPKVPRID